MQLITRVGEDVKTSEPSCNADGNVKGAVTLEDNLAFPQKAKQSYCMTQQFHF